LTQVLVTNRIAGFSTLIERLSSAKFQLVTPTIPRTETFRISAVNSQNPMEQTSIPLPSMKRKSLDLKWETKSMIFRNSATSFLCEMPRKLSVTHFLYHQSSQICLVALRWFSHWRFMDILEHYTQMDRVMDTWLELSYGMKIFSIKVYG